MTSFNYNKSKEYIFYNLARGFMRFWLKIIFRFRFVNAENIPKDGGFIIASNHISAIDPIFLAVNRRRKIHFMAKRETFKNPFAAWVITHFNAFPVNRGGSDKTSIEYAIKLVKDGKVLGIFPEGTRSPDSKPHSPKHGVALIAKEAKARVLPVAIYTDGKFKAFKKVTIRVGKMIEFDELSFSEEDKSKELKDASEYIMSKIVALWEEGPCS